LLEHANGGTLFIDNITALSSSQQRKLANFLQAKSFQRVGGIFPICGDVRILAGSCFSREEILDDGATAEPENETAISANANANANAGAAAVAPFITNSQKSAQSDEQDFRCKILSDLYYRLSSMFVCLPALSERVQDIALLTKRFSSMIALAQNVPQKNFSPEAIAVFETYPWPGDIQQLKNVIEWVLIMHASRADDTIKVEDLPPEIVEGNTFAKAWQARAAHFASMPMKEARDAFERDYLASQLRRFNWNVSQTARFIGIDRASLHRKLKSIGLGVTSGEEDAPHDILKVAK
jgi:two-component system nitrogen regulation response regulator NtrX